MTDISIIANTSKTGLKAPWLLAREMWMQTLQKIENVHQIGYDFNDQFASLSHSLTRKLEYCETVLAFPRTL